MKIDVPEFVSLKQIAALFNMSPSTAGRYSAEPDFPVPFYFSPGRKVWLKNEVVDWFMGRRRKAA